MHKNERNMEIVEQQKSTNSHPDFVLLRHLLGRISVSIYGIYIYCIYIYIYTYCIYIYIILVSHVSPFSYPIDWLYPYPPSETPKRKAAPARAWRESGRGIGRNRPAWVLGKSYLKCWHGDFIRGCRRFNVSWVTVRVYRRIFPVSLRELIDRYW